MKKIICIFFILAIFFQLPVYAEESDVIYTASVDGVCSLYISPSHDSYEVIKVPACAKIGLIDTDGTWNLVEYKNYVGWINSCYTRSTYSNAVKATGFDEKKTLQVDTGKNTARMYSELPVPGEDNRGEGIALPDGTILEMLRKIPSGWGLVAVNNKYMWIDTAYTHIYEGEVDEKQYGPYFVYVFSPEGSGVNLWEVPNSDNSLAMIPDCTQLIARETEGNYIYVSYKGMNGWVEADCTEESLFNAQMKSGSEVMKEAAVKSVASGDEIELLSAPSYDSDVAASVLATVEEDDDVFILRTVPSGWTLVLADGILGWLPPGSTREKPMADKKTSVTIYENPQTGFVATSEGEGIVLYSDPVDGIETSVIPETVSIEIVAEKNGYKYVRCEYGSGWSENPKIVPHYKESLTKYTNDAETPYIINQDTFLMSLPAKKGSYGSKGITKVKANVKVTPLRIVESSDNEWALVEIDETLGWINLSHMDSTAFPVLEVILAGAVMIVVLIIFSVWVKRKKTKKRKETETEKEPEETIGAEVSKNI